MSSSSFLNLLPQTLQTKNGPRYTRDVLNGKKKVAMYFSASWCSACVAFTPKLTQYYSNTGKIYGSNPVEIIWVSLEKDPQKHNEYYQKMPWTALSQSDAAQMISLFGQSFDGSIPYLAIVDIDTSNIIDNDAYSKISNLVTSSGVNNPQEIAKLLDLWHR